MRISTGLIGAIVILFLASRRSVAQPPGSDLPETLRVASVQMAVTGDIDVNLARIQEGIKAASKANARIVLFPETALSGFTREDVGRIDWEKLRRAMSAVAASAKESGIHVLYGAATPSGEARPFNSAILITPDGRELTRYHKMSPEAWFKPGDHLALFEIDGVPCTVMVCHDERFPEIVRLPVLSGAVVCFYISYEINSIDSAIRKAEGYRAQLIARAVENGIWLCQANGIGPLGAAERKSLGQSRFVDPRGAVVAEAPPLEDTMLVQDIHPREASRGNAMGSLQLQGLGAWWNEGLTMVRRSPSSGNVPIATASAQPARDKARLALMQAVPVKWDMEANFATFLGDLDVATANKADIFVAPECWLDGYAAADKASTPAKLLEIAQPIESSPT